VINKYILNSFFKIIKAVKLSEIVGLAKAASVGVQFELPI